MLNFISRQQPSLAGIDISSSSVKLLEIVKHNNQPKVLSYSSVALPANAIEDKHIKNEDMVIHAIRSAIEKSGSKAKRAVIAVPDSSVITKVIQMDASLSEMELEEMVTLEADKHIPYALDEVNLDFNVLGPSPKNQDLVDVLLVASRSDNVNSRTHVITQAGLEVGIVDVESYALERACNFLAADLPDHGKEKTIAVVDIGAEMTNITVLYNMCCIFTREELFGGRQLTDEIVTRYGLTLDEARQAKKLGALPDDYLCDVLQPFMETAVLQVRRSLQYFYSTSQQAKVDYILLSGGTAQISGLDALISEQLGVPAMVANPIKHMALDKGINVKELSGDASSMMICCGLAMRSV